MKLLGKLFSFFRPAKTTHPISYVPYVYPRFAQIVESRSNILKVVSVEMDFGGILIRGENTSELISEREINELCKKDDYAGLDALFINSARLVS